MTSLENSMELLLKELEKVEEIQIEQIIQLLSDRSYPTLLVLFSLPFCLPLQIPGFSTPFGIFLALIGLALFLRSPIWLPQWVLNKKISSRYVKACAIKMIEVTKKTKFFFHPRLSVIVSNPLLYRLNGFLIFFLSLFLALPLPLPFSNMLAAVPIFLIGIGLLKEDGLMILLSYAFTIFCFLAFFSLYLLGKAQFFS